MTAPRPTQLELTQIEQLDPCLPLGKSIDLSDGQIVKKTTGALREGIARRVQLPLNGWAEQFAEFKTGLAPHQAYVAGSMSPKLANEMPLVTERRLAKLESGSAIARTKEHLPFRQTNAGVCTIDCDLGGKPGDVPFADEINIRAKEELLAALIEVIPDLAHAGCAFTDSASANIWRTDTDEILSSTRRWHGNLAVEDATDIPRLIEIAHVRLWERGLGWIQLSSNGNLLVRSPVDLALRVPCQPVFGPPPDSVQPTGTANQSTVGCRWGCS